MAEPLVLDRVSLSFGDLAVLDDVSMRIEPGELVALLGPSGCGKSTVLSLIAGLLRPDAGALSGAGQCGWMPQDELLFAWRTVEANVALGLEVRGVPRREARDRARAILPLVGLEDFATARPRELSGGMRQRAALARTVLPDPDVLLLDEPFGALDALTRRSLQDWLERIWRERGHTIVLVTHDVREAARLADRVLVMSPRPGRIVAEVRLDRERDRSVVPAEVEAELLAHLQWSEVRFGEDHGVAPGSRFRAAREVSPNRAAVPWCRNHRWPGR